MALTPDRAAVKALEDALAAVLATVGTDPSPAVVRRIREGLAAHADAVEGSERLHVVTGRRRQLNVERGDVDLVINTPTGSGARTDGWQIRRAAVTRGIPCLTTLAAGASAARAISSARQGGAPPVLCLQELHRGRDTAGADTGRRGGEEAEGAAPPPDPAVPAR